MLTTTYNRELFISAVKNIAFATIDITVATNVKKLQKILIILSGFVCKYWHIESD